MKSAQAQTNSSVFSKKLAAQLESPPPLRSPLRHLPPPPSSPPPWTSSKPSRPRSASSAAARRRTRRRYTPPEPSLSQFSSRDGWPTTSPPAASSPPPPTSRISRDSPTEYSAWSSWTAAGASRPGSALRSSPRPFPKLTSLPRRLKSTPTPKPSPPTPSSSPPAPSRSDSSSPAPATEKEDSGTAASPPAVIGGGDSAMEEATFLTKYGSEVNIIHRRETFRASKIMQNRALSNPKIKVMWNSEVVEAYGDGEKGPLAGLKVKNVVTGEVTDLKVSGLFFAIGHEPATKFLDGQLELHPDGYVKTKPGTTETSVGGVFAAGDVQDKKYRQAVTAAGTGCMAALEAEHYLQEMGSQEGKSD